MSEGSNTILFKEKLYKIDEMSMEDLEKLTQDVEAEKNRLEKIAEVLAEV